jgi:hypothetical protein
VTFCILLTIEFVLNIINCHISYNKKGGIVVQPGNVRNLQICGCDIEFNMYPNGTPSANVFLDYSEGNSVEEGTIVGCTIQHSFDVPNSANIRCIRVGKFTIADNLISEAAVNIHLEFTRGMTITGNAIYDGLDYDLLVENSTDIIVGPNVFGAGYKKNGKDIINTFGAAYKINRKDGGSALLRGIIFRNCGDCIINGQQIRESFHNEGALVLENCRRFNITNCSILESKECGILLDNIDHVRVSDCMILNENKEKIALRITKGINNMITDNLFNGVTDIPPQSAQLENNLIIK